MTTMKRQLFAIVGVAIAAAVLAIGGRDAASPRQASRSDTARRVARGRYLVHAIGCADCHSPKKMGPKGPEEDPARFLSGHPENSNLSPAPSLPGGSWSSAASWDVTAFSGPWGISFTMNLTPDENTGIGSWSEDTFVKALRTGRHMGVSRPILPPMPWGAFRNMTDEDLKSIYAYLKTVTPVVNRVPEPQPPPGLR